MVETIVILLSTLLADGDRAFSQRDWPKAQAIYEKVYAKATDHPEFAVEAASQVARCLLLQGKKEDGRVWLAKAAKLVTQEMPKGYSRYLGVRGRFEWKDEKLEKATKTFEAMYAFCTKHELYGRAVDAAHMVAITGTPEQQLEWAHKGIEAAEKGKFDGWLGPLWNNLGVTYQEKGDWKKALECYRKAREYHWKHGREMNKLAADWAVAMALRETGEVEKAKQWLRPVLAWAERWYAEKPGPERGEWIGLACRELGYAMLEENPAEAKKLLGRAKNRLEAARMAEWDPKAWKKLLDTLASH
ncbi:MAG: tetratricopeptide repeat protein [Planctomycetota bacterium]|jgi:tetratricopeptide (TPR) repeat protein